nr:RecName: Full=30 kDa non-secretory protein 2 [Mycobacterium tuberculosis H37Rv]
MDETIVTDKGVAEFSFFKF